MLTDLMRAERKPIFVTFYSFKGGVGRTMALLNAACILAGRGRHVLMIDFDLEAPGLTSLANSDPALKSSPQTAGLVDLINDFLDDPESSVLADETNKMAFRERYVCPLPIPQTLQRLEGGYLDLMACGRMDENYESRLYSIKFQELYEEGVGLPLFQQFKKMILASGLYDYILIDSRTGFSDEGSICTRDLADHIVVMMGLNRQNVEGTGRFLEQLDQSGWLEEQGGQVVFVASPVPQGQEQLVEQRLNAARERFANTRFYPDFSLKIPYHPRLSLDEEPFGFDWSHTEIFPAYRQVHDKLSALADDPFSVSVVSGLINEGNFEAAASLLRALSVDAPNEVIIFLDELIGFQLPSNIDLRDHAEPFFELWLALTANNLRLRIIVLSGFGSYLIERGKYRRAKEVLELARQLNVSLSIPRDQGFVCQLLGTLAYHCGKYEDAIERFNKAAEYFVTANLPGNRVNVLYSSSLALAELQRFDVALEVLDRVMEYWRSIGYLLGEIHVNMARGIIKIQSGEHAEGLSMIRDSNDGYDRLRLTYARATGYVNYVWALVQAQEIGPAKVEMDQHWDYIQRQAEAASKFEAYVLRARIKQAQGDVEGARLDARIAADFYREQDVQTKLATEAEELANPVAKEA